MTIALWIAGVFLALQAVSLVMLMRVLLLLHLQKPKRTVISRDELPAHLLEPMEAIAKRLEALGFRPALALRIHGLGRYEKDGYGLLFANEAEQSFAELDNFVVPNVGRPLNVSFVTPLEPDHALLTVNGTSFGYLGTFPKTVVYDAFAPSMAAQWKAHLAKLASMKAAARRTVTPEELLAEADADGAGLVDGLVRDGDVKEVAPGVWRLRFFSALLSTFPLRVALSRHHKWARREFQIDPELTVPVAMEVEAFERQEEVTSRSLGPELKLWTFIASLALAAVSFMSWATGEWLVLTLVVLAFHELGHFFAMRLFGFNDTAIFFVPFFGAITTGRSDKATVTQRVVVALAGPLPGLVLGAGLFALQAWLGTYSSLLHKTALMFVVLNAVNLAPLLPLDGGHVVNHLLFSRMPRVEAGFRFLAAAAFLAFGVWASSGVTLFLGVFGLLSLATSYRRARLASMLHGLPELPPSEAVRKSFEWLRANGHAELGFTQKAQLVRGARLMVARPGNPWAMAALGAAYLALVIGVPVGAVMARDAFFPPRPMPVHRVRALPPPGFEAE